MRIVLNWEEQCKEPRRDCQTVAVGTKADGRPKRTARILPCYICGPRADDSGPGGVLVTKHWTNWTLVVMALAVTATGAAACDGHPAAAEAKDAAGPAVAAPVPAMAAAGDAKGCDMPCCAHAKGTADAKSADAKSADPKSEAAVKADAPCTAHDAKGCPRKATAAGAVAKAEPAKDAPQAQPAADSPKAVPATDPGTRR